MRGPTPVMRALSAALLVGLTTCEGFDDFEVEQTAVGEIPAATPLDKLLQSLDLEGFRDISFSQSLQNQGLSAQDVDSMHLVSVRVAITAPEEATFDFLDSMVFYVETEGQPRVELARLDRIPKGARELELGISGPVDLTPYIAAPSLAIVSEVAGQFPEKKTSVQATLLVAVDVAIPGC